MAKKTADDSGVPVRIEDVRYPDGVAVALPLPDENVPEPAGSGSKSGQKATTQKKES